MSNRNSSQRRLENTIRKLVRETVGYDSYDKAYDPKERVQFEELMQEIAEATDELLRLMLIKSMDLGGTFRSPGYTKRLGDMMISKVREAMRG